MQYALYAYVLGDEFTQLLVEQMHYRDIFTKYYKSASAQKTIPYFWMPKFVKATDASARVLDIYKQVNE